MKKINIYRVLKKEYLKKVKLDKTVSFFYHTFIIPFIKGKSARKIQPTIKRFYTAIKIKRIQKWLNNNENHFRINPIFSNKPPLSSVVSKTVLGCNQIVLVNMRSMSVTKMVLNIIIFLHCWMYSHGFWNLDHYSAKIPAKYCSI